MAQGLSNNQIVYRNSAGNFIFNREVGGKNYAMVSVAGFFDGKPYMVTRNFLKNNALKTEFGGGRFSENMPTAIADLFEQDIKVGIEALSFTYNPLSNQYGGSSSPWSPTTWDAQRLDTVTLPTIGSTVAANVWYGASNTVVASDSTGSTSTTDTTDTPRSADTFFTKAQKFIKDNPVLVIAILILIAAVVYFVVQYRNKDKKMKDLQVQLSTAKGKDKKQLQAEYQRLLAA
jgi:hypothetical protein